MTITARQKTAFIFPGQGSQKVGMAHDLLRESRAARRVLEEADAIMEHRLLKIMLEGPEEELKRTEIAQPAIVATSIAAHAAMEEWLDEQQVLPACLAGHSLGEYTALAIAHVLSLEEVLILIKARGRFMQQACEERPGGMVALVGIDEIAVEEVCKETDTSIANLNTFEQIIISGTHRNLVMAIDLAAARGARKCITLEVDGAFHSGLMEPARSGLIDVLKSLKTWKDPIVPLIANCSAKPLTLVEEIWEELILQLTSCVRWEQSVHMMLGQDIKTFVEIGPGRVLSGLIKRIDKNVKVISVSDMDSIRALTA